MAYGAMGQPPCIFDDPLESGIASVYEWHALYERFWLLLNMILPLRDLGLARSTPPSHPFIRTALLYYLACVQVPEIVIPEDRRRSIYDFMTQQVGLALQSQPNEEVAVGMLILSHSSVRQTEDATGFADPFRAVALGLDMALELALDDAAERFRLGTAEESWIQDDISKRKVCLWYAICHRHTFNKILSSVSLRPGPRSSPIPAAIPLLRALASGSDLLAHLAVESELFGLINGVLSARQTYADASEYDADLLVDYYKKLDQSLHELEQFRATIRQNIPVSTWKFLLIQSYYVSYAVAQQGVNLAQSMPSPVASDIRFEYLGISGLTMIIATASLLDNIVAGMLPLSSLPGVLIPPIYLIIAGYKSWRLKEVMENMDPPRVAPDLKAVYDILKRQHAKAKHILSRISAMREQISEAAVRRDETRRTASSGLSGMIKTNGQDNLTSTSLVGPNNWSDEVLYLPEFDLAWLEGYNDPVPSTSQSQIYHYSM